MYVIIPATFFTYLHHKPKICVCVCVCVRKLDRRWTSFRDELQMDVVQMWVQATFSPVLCWILPGNASCDAQK